MNQTTLTLSPSDIIQIISIIVSFSTSIVAIVISLKAIKQTSKTIEQNNRMLEEASRPYITIYLDSFTICEQTSFFVLKNFGNSSATITRFEYSNCLKTHKQCHKLFNEQFEYVRELTLAPGQSKLFQYDVTELTDETLSFIIGYVHANRYYEENIILNTKNHIHIPVSRPDSHILDGNERQVHTLSELLERTI